jgi:hypothetical protein
VEKKQQKERERKLIAEKETLFSKADQETSESVNQSNTKEILPDLSDGQNIFFYKDKRESLCKD